MKKILNILSGFSLSVSLPLTLVACDKKNDEKEEPPTKPKPVVTPIKKFESFKDFLKANTNFEEVTDPSEISSNDPKWILYNSLADNNFTIGDPDFFGPIQKQFSDSLSDNLSDSNHSFNYVFEDNSNALEEPIEFDFVDANGNNIFWNAVKIVRENATKEEPVRWMDMVEFYQSFLPWILREDTSLENAESYVWTYDDEIAAQTFYDYHYIKFEVFESSILWDLKPDNEKGSEVIYWGNDKDLGVHLKPYEDTCDMPWLANNQWCKEE